MALLRRRLHSLTLEDPTEGGEGLRYRPAVGGITVMEDRNLDVVKIIAYKVCAVMSLSGRNISFCSISYNITGSFGNRASSTPAWTRHC